ncbi:hypothetical protein [Haliangium sp. UPWRP_2]|uniref:hypothetical protein n=1 Tax=Haliangium sp. UPWRP_2 TaxID=1931276 RepID=UPI000B541D82|nr:hypothetical protein [Haliangium sp. UPWRP_2]PSM32465.1 hypothetical protein BVG81_000210 [Haliangium sp. UPWRP_2]
MYSRLWQWPARDPHFVGRSVELGRLHGLLDVSRRVLVLGPAGLGKRSLIVEYGHRFAACYGPYGGALQAASAGQIGAPPPSHMTTGLVLVTDGEPAAGDAPSPALLTTLRRFDRSAPAAYLVAATASEELAHTVEREGFLVLSLPPLPDEDGLALLIACSDRHQADPLERQAARTLVAQAAGRPARLRHLANLARTEDLSWSECLRRDLI